MESFMREYTRYLVADHDSYIVDDKRVLSEDWTGYNRGTRVGFQRSMSGVEDLCTKPTQTVNAAPGTNGTSIFTHKH
jgi:hypothetical protein